jgi:predicted ester cyclase
MLDRELYERYLQRCNDHQFDRLHEFVHERVEVNGLLRDLTWYAAGLRRVTDEFPDFHWTLEHLVIDGSWLAAHLTDSYTTPSRQAATYQELAMYRFKDGRIAQVWGDLEQERLIRTTESGELVD